LNSPAEPACCSLLLPAWSPAEFQARELTKYSRASNIGQVQFAAVLLTMSQLLANLHCQAKQHSPSDAAFAALEPWPCFGDTRIKTRPVPWQRLRHNSKADLDFKQLGHGVGLKSWYNIKIKRSSAAKNLLCCSQFARQLSARFKQAMNPHKPHVECHMSPLRQPASDQHF
jgi:hypothetical protein